MLLIAMDLCSRFPALSPFAVYRESFHKVLVLFFEYKHAEEKYFRKKENPVKTPDGSFVRGNTLYVPAQDDDWF